MSSSQANQGPTPPLDANPPPVIVPTPKLWQCILAEFVGTALFIFAVCGSVVIPATYLGASPGVAAIVTALVQGFTLIAVVAIFGSISGSHFNPAVSVVSVLIGSSTILAAIGYIVAQLCGAMVGAGLFRAAVKGWRPTNLGSTTVAPYVSTGEAVLIEFIITSILLFVVVGTSRDTRQGLYILAPIPIGLSVLVGVLIAKTLTGASMNPARSFGPAVVSGTWTDHWIYWLAPMCAAIFVALVFWLVTRFNVSRFLRRPANQRVAAIP